MYVCATFYFLALNLSRIFDRVKKDSIIEEKTYSIFKNPDFLELIFVNENSTFFEIIVAL